MDEYSAREGGDRRAGGAVVSDTLADEHPEHPTPYNIADCPECTGRSEPVVRALKSVQGVQRAGFDRGSLYVKPLGQALLETVETARRYGWTLDRASRRELLVRFTHTGSSGDGARDADGGDTPDVEADGGLSPAAADWQSQAETNVQKWGSQPVDALTLAMIEEMGEFAADILASRELGDTDRVAEHGRDLLRRMESLGEDTQDYLEMVSEDSEGNPIPPEDRPTYLSRDDDLPHQKLFDRRARGELDDMMALGFQALWALEPEDGGSDE